MVRPISTGGPEGGGEMGLGDRPYLYAVGGGGSEVAPDGSVSSSFGVDEDRLYGFKANGFVNSRRHVMLARRSAYYDSTHHDWKGFDFDGRQIQPGPPTSQPLLSADMGGMSAYVPLRMRRPSAPYRLPRVIVNSFTSLLFGYGRWPTIRVHGDPRSEDFVNAIVEATKLRTIMIRARNIGGSVGTVGLSWRFYDGKPIVQAHSGTHLHVHEWVDREQSIPEHVTEVYQFPRDEYDHKRGQFVRNLYWARRDWTPVADITFQDVLFQQSQEPRWVIDDARTHVHNDGFAHFVWIPNLPEGDGTDPDGQPDYAELYENFDSIDLLKSVIVRGATLNLDPTLVLRLDPDIVARTGVRKGSDNSLVVGESGDARYMELSGQSITSGVSLLEKMREAVLEVAQCVIPDPNKIGAAGTSSVALKVVYEPMLAKSEVLREQYGYCGIARLLQHMLLVAQRRYGAVEIEVTEEGEERDVRAVVTLPPRIDVVAVKDDAGNPTGEETIVRVERVPGEGGQIELDWPDYFNPTATDMQNMVTTYAAAATNGIMSKQSASEEVSALYGRNAREEWKRVEEDRQRKVAEQAAQFAGGEPGAGAGGEVGDEGELPTGAVPSAPSGGASRLELTSTDLAAVTTVNEARASVGLAPLRRPDGTEDPAGRLTVAEFRSQREAKGEALGAATGEAEAPAKAERVNSVYSSAKLPEPGGNPSQE